MAIFNQISIIGVGLMGASVGKTALTRGATNYVIGWDVSEKELRDAERVRAISMAATSLEQCVQDSDLIVLATPIRFMTDYIQQAAKANKRSALITDLGSVKDTLVSFFNDHPLENGCRYLGSHPMAGKEVSGAANADDRLFDNCITVITPCNDTTEEDVTALAKFWRSLGAKIDTVSSEFHDSAAAQISHLPHLVSAALASTIDPGDAMAMLMASTGLESMIRLANGSPSVWTDVLLSNKDFILDEANAFVRNLGSFMDAMENDDRETLTQLLLNAQNIRRGVTEIKEMLKDIGNDDLTSL